MLTRDELLEVVNDVKALPTIVEGKRDTIALKKLGFTNIHEIDRALFVVVERVQDEPVVQVLTDYDRRGRDLYRKLTADLKKFNVVVDERLHNALRKTKVSHIEGLDSYIARLP